MNPLKWPLPPLGPSSDPVDQGEDGDSYDLLSPPSGPGDDDDEPPAPPPPSAQEQNRPHTPPAPSLPPKQDSPHTPPPLIPGKRTVTHGIKYDRSPSEWGPPNVRIRGNPLPPVIRPPIQVNSPAPPQWQRLMYNENRQPASRTLPTFPEDEDPETEEVQRDSDEEMRESSPDLGGYDAVEQCDALIVDALSELSECLDSPNRSLFSLSDAVEYAFNSKSDSRLPSEPSQ